jgi:phenylacetate-CoA ligase
VVDVFVSTLTQDRENAARDMAARSGWSPMLDVPFVQSWRTIPVSDATYVCGGAELDTTERGGASILFSSGGSTGSPKVSQLSVSEVIRNSAAHGTGYSAAGVSSSDIVATWGVPGLLTSEFTCYLALAETGCCILPIGSGADPATIVSVITSFHATALLVLPSILAPVVRYLESIDERLTSVRLVVTGGEPLYPADEAKFRSRLGDHVTFRSVFQTSEVGTIGYQCIHCAFDEYHVQEDLQLLELVDCTPDGVGELVTTNLDRTTYPVVRRRTGDLAELVTGECGCKRSAPRIRLRGRTGQFVKLGGEKFDIGWFREFRSLLGIRIDDLRIVLTRLPGGNDQLTIRSNYLSNHASARQHAVKLLRDSSLKLDRQLANGVIAEPVFEDLTPDQVNLTIGGKNKLFEDRRG